MDFLEEEYKMNKDKKLTKLQQKAFDYMVKGNNIFLTGQAGTGKSLIIHTFKALYGNQKNIAITSTTGVSAIVIGGTTLHSYLGIGLGTGSVDDLATKIMKSAKARQRWLSLDVLVIDEISMLSAELFDKLEQVARIVRRKNLPRMLKEEIPEQPFGGIQLVLSGDFLQLPVVGDENRFCFEADSWNKCIEHTIELTENMRQSDSEFQSILTDLRYGKLTKNAKKLLQSRIGVELKNDLGIKPTRIYTTNAVVDMMNEKELDKLAQDNDFYQYDMEIYFYEFVQDREQAIEKYRKNSLAPERLQLCKGAQVMLLYNLDVQSGLANGSRGMVIDFLEGLPIVRFLNGVERPIDFYCWEVEEGKKKVVRITQMPLKLAWAVTSHKCVTGDTIIYTENGMQRIKSLVHPCQGKNETKDIDLNVYGRNGLEKCTQIYRGKIEKTIVATTSLGYRIEGSHRHPVLTYNSQETWKKLPDLKIGDYIVLQSGTKCFGQNIDTQTYQKPSECYVDYQIPEKVEEKLGYVIGVLIGNGCYSVERDYPVELTVSKFDTDIIDTFQSFSKEIFGTKFRLGDYTNKSVYKLMLNSKQIRSFFLWCGLKYDLAHEKSIPWVIMQNTRETQIECLKGLFDTVGDVHKDCVNFTTTSRFLASDVQTLLLNLGIISSLKEMNGKTRENFRQTYRVQISGYHGYQFYKLVGFHLGRKQQELEDKFGKHDHFWPKSNICDIPNGDEKLRKIRDNISTFHSFSRKDSDKEIAELSMLFSRIICGKSSLRFDHLEFLCETLTKIYKNRSIPEEAKELFDLQKNGLFFDKIVKIKGSMGTLYDIYVPESHSFVGNGIINHNSQGCTLDYAEVDLSNIFAYGQAYVALSRVKSADGLSIIEINFDGIRAHPKALEFYEHAETEE